ncbi:Aste57867_9097 [Aphanomyces stellatus]|uniref:Aste57867_9097 protein n=1 Tax=Aphanomyces stellatus TaxID=120398 RepID=A0A485KM51_9STRA|nr:hypothetical protein As57867_009061 [Aphanomyces stellatus]VFT85981.1 Aste57867_9097 [Aphanomyces stellatus]
MQMPPPPSRKRRLPPRLKEDAGPLRVLGNQELVTCICDYQCGIYDDMRPFAAFMPWNARAIGCAIAFALKLESASFQLLETLHSVWAPWYRRHGTSRLSHLWTSFSAMHHLVCVLACYSGNLDLMRVLHTCTHRVMLQVWMDMLQLLSLVAWRGHLPMLQYLHGKQYYGWTRTVLDVAAANGHLPVVEFLHSNRSEGCTTEAMDRAAARGHLHVVSFLHLHRHEGCTHKALEGAVAAGHVDVVAFLVEQRSECRSKARLQLLAMKHPTMAYYLQELIGSSKVAP